MLETHQAGEIKYLRLDQLVWDVGSEGLQTHGRRLVDVYKDTLII